MARWRLPIASKKASPRWDTKSASNTEISTRCSLPFEPHPSLSCHASPSASRFLDRWSILTILTRVSNPRHQKRANATAGSPRYTYKEASFKANQVCELFDISKATLFRWEREGVIAQPDRDWRNWRLYTRKNVDEIEKVIRVRKAVA
ncbi:MAG: hypothetical protein CV081_11660 [Nitrospira sp. LK265]|nr:hypothetical protein [Nitrospira sp. LK265]